MTDITPGILMIIAAVFVPYLPHHIRQIFMLGFHLEFLIIFQFQ